MHLRFCTCDRQKILMSHICISSTDYQPDGKPEICNERAVLWGIGAEPPAAGSHWWFGGKAPSARRLQFFCNNKLILGLVG